MEKEGKGEKKGKAAAGKAAKAKKGSPAKGKRGEKKSAAAKGKKKLPRSGHIAVKVKVKKARGKKAGEEKEAGKPVKAGKGQEKGRKVPGWVELKPEEAVEAIVNLANAGHTQSEIGMLLRDQYGVPDVKALAGKSVAEILGENSLLSEIPEDLMNLIRKSVELRRHLEKNRKDFTAKRGLQITVSKIRRLVKYYKKKGVLPLDWRYTEETAALLVK